MFGIFDRWVFAVCLIVVAGHGSASGTSNPQECQVYPDYSGNKISIHPPAFADAAICPGKRGCFQSSFFIRGQLNIPDNAVGPPDFRKRKRRSRRSLAKPSTLYTLGCRRSGIWRFDDNAIADVPGPDLFVFEAGHAKEPTRIELSSDRKTWIDIGRIEGSRASIDISGQILPGSTYRFVRLTDLGSNCDHDTEGADIDAIAALGLSWTVSVDETAFVFFEFASAKLTSDAELFLNQLAAEYQDLNGYNLRVDGHTDGIGTANDNQRLSEVRAKSVAEYLIANELMPRARVFTRGLGETQSRAPNTTSKNRARNRRVELTFLPTSPCPPSQRVGSRKLMQDGTDR